jgi:hypothetical protein
MDYAAIVDQLGALKAQIAALTDQEKALKKALTGSGFAEIDGDLFRATVNWTERATLDSDAVRAILTPDQVRVCTRTTEIMTVRVVARKRAAA